MKAVISEEKFPLTQKIINYYIELGLHEEHPLFELTVETMCGLTPDPINPCQVYKKLKEIQATFPKTVPPLLPEVPIKVSSSDQCFQWNMTTLREKGIAWQGYTRKDLPKNVDSKTLQKLYDDMIARIEKLPAEDKETINERIMKGSSCNSLRNLFSSMLNAPEIQNWLKEKEDGGDEDQISIQKFQLFSILRAILDCDSTTLVPGTLLTMREDKLIGMATTIQLCPIGRNGGILDAYQRIPISYKLGPQFTETLVEGSREKKIIIDFDIAMQNALEKTFSKGAFLQEATNSQVVHQPVHQTLYFKNLIAPCVGLKEHRLTFDQHITVLASVVDKDPKDITEVFLRHLTPCAIEAAIRFSEKEIFKNGAYDDCLTVEPILRKGKPWSKDKQPEYEDYLNELIIFNDKYIPLSFTKKGAVAFLTGLEYLKSN